MKGVLTTAAAQQPRKLSRTGTFPGGTLQHHARSLSFGDLTKGGHWNLYGRWPCSPPTLTVGPNGPFSILDSPCQRFEYESLQLKQTPVLVQIHFLARMTNWSKRQGCWVFQTSILPVRSNSARPKESSGTRLPYTHGNFVSLTSISGRV